MKSKIINMVDRLRDKEDLRLDALLKSDPVPDLDFSQLVMKRLRRQMWIRRLTMPMAVFMGGLIAFKPASELIVTVSKVITALPIDLTIVSVDIPSLSVGWLPQMTTIVFTAAIALVALILAPTLED